uniref:Putative glycine dehydrogenase n=1 Tax=termite gut metagenome TaxID=433724 RepID=S0DDF1_9ZZZZ
MGGYLPTTGEERRQMLDFLGLESHGELFRDIPQQLLAQRLDLPDGKSELEVRRQVTAMQAKNRVFGSIFRGAGAYSHYIPAVVKQIAAKETFITAYTPYQAEISQGVLQAIFEFQSGICALTGLDVSNASVYDGASAAAEAVLACRERARSKVLVAETAAPGVKATIGTYCESADAPLETVAAAGGVLDHADLDARLADDVACLYVQSPNFFGQIEDVAAIAEACHARGVRVVMGCNPLALALLKTPAELGADMAVGEAQPLGLPLSFGGPYLGFMAAKKELMRKIPGRIVGQTTDNRGNRCFVLTMQAREQHIRREKASSSLCSNQALCALTATAYLAAMGPQGLRDAAQQCYAKAHYLADALRQAGYPPLHEGDFFHEFVTACPADPQALMDRLAAEDILGGLPVEGGILWCCTELNTKAEMDRVAEICREVAAG